MSRSENNSDENKGRAVLWMLGTLLSFCLMAIGARELNITDSTDIINPISVLQILFVRSVLGLMVLASAIGLSKNSSFRKPRRIKLHLLRNVFHFAGQYGWFVGIGLLPLTTVFSIEFTVPLWTIVISYLFLREPITVRKVVAVLLGLIGVLVIVQPSSVDSVDVVNYASLIVLASAICYAVAHTSTKALTMNKTIEQQLHGESPMTILVMMCLIQLPLGLLFLIEGWTIPTDMQWVWLIIIGLTALSAHYCMTKAMLYAEVGFVVTMDLLRLPLISLVGVWLYTEHFSWALIAGMTLIVLGNLVNLYSRSNK